MSSQSEHMALLEKLASKGDYKSLTEVVDDIKTTSKSGLQELGNFSHPIFSEQKIARVEEFLASENIDKVAFIGLGSEAIVVQTHDNEVLRIFNQSTGERPDTPEMLQPHAVARGGGLLLEFVLKADTKNVTQDDRNALIASVIENGYMFDDSKMSNIGKLQDGTPIIIDGDALKEIPKIVQPIAKPVLRAINKLMGNEINDSHNYGLAQKEHKEQVGLQEGKFGLVNKDKAISSEKNTSDPESTQWRDEILSKDGHKPTKQR